MTDNYTDLRDWFTNMIFAGKTLEQINKMPKSTLDKLDVEYDKLIALITQRETAARIDEWEHTNDPDWYNRTYYMDKRINELKTLTKPDKE